MSDGNSFDAADPILHIGFMTLNISRPNDPRRAAWLTQLAAYRGNPQAEPDLVRFLDTCTALIEANGDPSGLGADLTGHYARVWAVILQARAS